MPAVVNATPVIFVIYFPQDGLSHEVTDGKIKVNGFNVQCLSVF